jgi:sugar lactone lactonase YvrE
VTLQLPAQSYAEEIAFDGAGNMWVLNNVADNVVEFTPAQFQTGGAPSPTVTISLGTAENFTDPLAMAFDAHGNLWVIAGGQENLLEFTSSQLATTGTPTPALERSLNVMYPFYIAFDPSGNFWIADGLWYNNNVPIAGKITEFTAGSVATVTNPSPTLTLPLPVGVKYPAWPTAVAFDDSGDLWYSDFENNVIGEFTAAQLAAGGSPTPAVTILNSRINGTAIAFNPHSAALPLH